MIGGGVFASFLRTRAPWAVPYPCSLAMAGVALSFVVALADAQGVTPRVHQVHSASEPEGRLLAFYSAAMVFSPLGALPPGASWALALEGGWIPPLNEAQRRPGIDKPETTNLSPLLPRPRLAIRTPIADIEASWIPPVTIADARANLTALALTRTLGRWHSTGVATRLSVVGGRVRGAITCNARTAARGGAALATYYANVCHGRDSDDWFEPRLAAGELVATRSFATGAARWAGGPSHVWMVLGARLDRSRFDIGVVTADGARDLDHPIVKLRSTRPHVASGVGWRLGGRLAASLEAFYAPASMLTLRAAGAVVGSGR